MAASKCHQVRLAVLGCVSALIVVVGLRSLVGSVTRTVMYRDFYYKHIASPTHSPVSLTQTTSVTKTPAIEPSPLAFVHPPFLSKLVPPPLQIVPAKPISRVFVLYVPFVPTNPFGPMDEMFGMVESWRFVYGRLESPAEEPVIPTAQIGKLHGPTFNANRAFPVGVPYINDLLIVTDPRINDDFFPWICRVIYGDEPHTATIINIPKRSQLADDPSTNSSILSRCFVLKTYLASTQFQPSWTLHPAMHSVAALADPAVAAVINLYDLALRSDNDCFLAPFLNSPRYVPWRMAPTAARPDGEFAFMVGGGGYSSFATARLLPEYARLLGLRHQKVRSIGSSWYGRPRDVVAAARLTVQVGEYLLLNDPVISSGDGGEWPDWCRCVLLLYSGEMAINHVVDKSRIFVRPKLLDTLSAVNRTMALPDQLLGGEDHTLGLQVAQDSTQPLAKRNEVAAMESGSTSVVAKSDKGFLFPDGVEAERLHIHCWHTDQFYSKHAFASNKYDASIFQHKEYDILRVDYYSFSNAWNGQQRRKLQILSSNSVPIPLQLPLVGPSRDQSAAQPSDLNVVPELQDVPVFMSPRIASLQLSFFFCPSSHPFPYSASGTLGGACCGEPLDCESKPLSNISECCLNHEFAPCGSAPCRPNPAGLAATADKSDMMDGLRLYLSTLPLLEIQGIKSSLADGHAEFRAMLTEVEKHAFNVEPQDADECPTHHPYPYTPEAKNDRSYCCKHDKDCNGIILGSNSSCCFDHKFTRCLSSPCRPNRAVLTILTKARRYGLSAETPAPQQDPLRNPFVQRLRGTLKSLGYLPRAIRVGER
eukprot:GHVS01052499.1.p1 GENE.GHVS01052499.1~~GHVS01052499.1.p1  ORF type:complete len:819 (+),score=71.54 GHVS01052499.1:2745-5201(+)